VHVHDFGITRSFDGARAGASTEAATTTCFFTSDFVRGLPLSTFAAGRAFEDVRAPLVDAVSALAFLHRAGVVHGDFKPENVLATEAGATLIDLSCARRVGQRDAPISGTPLYVAPEVLRGGPTDARADLFAVGRTLESIGELVRGGLPPRIAALASRCLHADPATRPVDASEILEALGASARALHVRSREASRLHGRDEALSRARDVLANASVGGDSAPRIVSVCGAPGAGKTRLLREIAWLAELEHDAIEGFPNAGARVVDGMLRRALGADAEPHAEPTSSPLDVREALRELDARARPMLVVVDDAGALGAEDRAALATLAGTVASRRWL
jgi:serine/threonine protein kinase